MRSITDWRRARVASVEEAAEGVRRIVFDVADALSSFDPGSHTNIRVSIDGMPAIRTYTCLPAGPGQIAIGVKLHPNSRGGSRFIWSLQPDDEVRVTAPENRFELSWRAGSYLLLAGGIGITPIYGMARALAARNAPLRMVYGGQSRGAMPFLGELATLLGDRLEIAASDEGRRIDVGAEIAALAADGELYVCGPLGLLDAVKQAWARAGRPVSRLRYEVFGDNGKFAEQPFEVTILNRDLSILVPPDKSLLDAMAEAGVDMIHDCRRGECGLCAVDLVEVDGQIDHRDVFFSDDEKREGKRMCACVSRIAGGRAVIDTGYRV